MSRNSPKHRRPARPKRKRDLNEILSELDVENEEHEKKVSNLLGEIDRLLGYSFDD